MESEADLELRIVGNYCIVRTIEFDQHLLQIISSTYLQIANRCFRKSINTI
jgi:hypothetical protein